MTGGHEQLTARLDEVTVAMESLTAMLDTGLDLGQMLQAVCDHVVQVVPGADMASITLVRDGVPETVASTDQRAVNFDREQYRIVDPDSIAGKCQRRALPGGGWRTVSINNDRSVGFMVEGWDGVAWAPTAGALAKRKFWVIEGVPKDKYYLYGRIELWIDDQSWQGAWNRKFSWQNELLNVYQVMGFASADFNDKERFWGSTQGFQCSENIKAERATV